MPFRWPCSRLWRTLQRRFSVPLWASAHGLQAEGLLLGFGFFELIHWRNRRQKRKGRSISQASWQEAGWTRSRRNCRYRGLGPRLQRGVDEAVVGWRCGGLGTGRPLGLRQHAFAGIAEGALAGNQQHAVCGHRQSGSRFDRRLSRTWAWPTPRSVFSSRKFTSMSQRWKYVSMIWRRPARDRCRSERRDGDRAAWSLCADDRPAAR